jgi:5-methyltetrahydropteroyltriglutamate--homocysteine methyltransferase
MRRMTPPFRADQVGSLLRPGSVKEARARRERGEMTAAELQEIENREIDRIIGKQEQIELPAVTDGELRRSWWHFDFLKGLEGVEGYTTSQGIQFRGAQTRNEGVKVTGKLGFSSHPMLEHFRYLKAHTRAVPKMTIPSPSVLHFRGGRAGISPDVYPDLDTFFDDLAQTYGKAVRAFADAGCRYLQLDDTVWGYLCSQEQREQARQRGDDLTELPRTYARVINTAIEARPRDMVITTHVCRGNFRSTWISEGGYEPVAEVLLGQVNVDGYFLEYDTDRAGGFEPLRFLPKGKKQVVLGLITSKSGALERRDDVKRRIEEATKYADLEQLCLSPQCGFASTEEGNILSEDQQWAKLELIVALSREVWG